MVVGGLAFTLAGACPTRQLFLSGEGDVDALFFVMGMFAGIGLAQRLEFVVRPDIVLGDTMLLGGPNLQAIIAAMVGLAACLTIGATRRRKQEVGDGA
jgi:hypothetical protein